LNSSATEPSPGAPSPGAPSPGAPSPGAPSPGAPSPGAPSPGAPSAIGPFVADLVRASLQVLQREQSALYPRLAQALGPLHVCVVVDRECFAIKACAELITLVSALEPVGLPANCEVRVATDCASIAAVLGGLTLLDAILTDRLRVQAAPEVLLRARDAFELYLQSLVRCPSAPNLLTEFHRQARLRTARHVDASALAVPAA
jgi:hypothetical protein